MPTLLSELTKHGLVLWRVRCASRQLWCAVEDFAGELVLRVRDPAAGQPELSEVHLTIASAIDQAEALRDQFMVAGWEAVDVDPDEPDCWSHQR